MHNSTITGCTDGIGIVTNVTLATTVVTDTMLTDNTGSGIKSNDSPLTLVNNRFRNNGANVTGSADWVSAESWGDVTSGSTSDYVDSTVSDYRLATGSPARGVGVPLYRDIGALQTTNAVSAGGSFIFAQ